MHAPCVDGDITANWKSRRDALSDSVDILLEDINVVTVEDNVDLLPIFVNVLDDPCVLRQVTSHFPLDPHQGSSEEYLALDVEKK